MKDSYYQVIDPAWQENKSGRGSRAAKLKGIEGSTEASPQGHVGKSGSHCKLNTTTYIEGGEWLFVVHVSNIRHKDFCPSVLLPSYYPPSQAVLESSGRIASS